MKKNYPEFQFEKLVVWQEARRLNKLIYQQTSEFPTTEQFGLTKQIRRASVSVASNIVEGNSRRTVKDKAHFITVSYGSLMEMMGQVILTQDLDFIQPNQVLEIREQTAIVAKLLSGFRKSQFSN